MLALRLYTTLLFKTINDPLRDQQRHTENRPHPLPVLVAEKEFFIDNLLVRVHRIDWMSWLTGAPRDFLS